MPHVCQRWAVRSVARTAKRSRSRPATSPFWPAPGINALKASRDLMAIGAIRRAANTTSTRPRPSTRRRSPPSAAKLLPAAPIRRSSAEDCCSRCGGHEHGLASSGTARIRSTSTRATATFIIPSSPGRSRRRFHVAASACSITVAGKRDVDQVAAAGRAVVVQGALRVCTGIAVRASPVRENPRRRLRSVERLPDCLLDLIVLHSVAHYRRRKNWRNSSRCFIGC